VRRRDNLAPRVPERPLLLGLEVHLRDPAVVAPPLHAPKRHPLVGHLHQRQPVPHLPQAAASPRRAARGLGVGGRRRVRAHETLRHRRCSTSSAHAVSERAASTPRPAAQRSSMMGPLCSSRVACSIGFQSSAADSACDSVASCQKSTEPFSVPAHKMRRSSEYATEMMRSSGGTCGRCSGVTTQ